MWHELATEGRRRNAGGHRADDEKDQSRDGWVDQELESVA